VIYVTELEAAFYASTSSIISQVGLVLVISVLVSLILLFLFSDYLTRPLRGVVDAMTGIIQTNDLSKRVDVLYRDETGRLAHTFNLMTEQLDQAYDHIKSYAMRAESLRIKEQKTRTMFQKYVPTDVIEEFFANPEAMLVGDNRVVSILFSDIRDFTTISEMMQPDALVQTLNKYFTVMVDTIMSHNGIVDKYIGDAIMALFGTPKKRPDDAEQSAYAALDMIESLKDFNIWQEKQGIPPFRIGVGLNYGVVTVGNIGSEKKLDYTVIGDMVNVASRLEVLTKKYKTSVVVSDSVHRKLEADIESGRVSSRFLDTVQVKGRSTGLRVCGIAREIGDREQELWNRHNEGMELFYRREFAEARKRFLAAGTLREGDVPSAIQANRCAQLEKNPPGEAWTGIVEMTEK
jgi:class 3 adenylate cyclase/HAMP domain-containing protein